MKIKRLLCIISAAVAICILSLSSLADSGKRYDIINEIGGFSAHSVYVRYIPGSGDLNKYYGEDTEGTGNYVVKTKGGLTVRIDNSLRRGLVLVVREVTPENGEAYNWFMKCAKGLGERIFPLDIYYLDRQGNKLQVDPGTRVFFTIAGERYRYADVYGLGFDGNVYNSDAEFTDNGHRITVGNTEYYLLAGKDTENDPAGNENTAVTVPKTGDSDLPLKAAMLLMAAAECVIIYILFFAFKKEKDNEEQ